jgi:hypothetical protein
VRIRSLLARKVKAPVEIRKQFANFRMLLFYALACCQHSHSCTGKTHAPEAFPALRATGSSPRPTTRRGRPGENFLAKRFVPFVRQVLPAHESTLYTVRPQAHCAAFQDQPENIQTKMVIPGYFRQLDEPFAAMPVP